MARLTPVIRFTLWLATASWLAAQVPTVGDINVYGLRKTPHDKLQAALALKAGDPLPPSKGDLEERLEELPTVVRASVTALCCEDGKAILFAGVEEKGAAHFALRTPPAGGAVLPQDALDLYRRFLEAVEAATRRGSTAEDLTQGHSLLADATARGLQLEMAAWVKDHLPLTRDVLRNASDEEQRAIAAAYIGYAPSKKDVVDDLQYAVQDPDEAVRANAMRSLAAIAVLARDPAKELKVSATWFVEMLNSVILSDRLKATEALLTLTDDRNFATLSLLNEKALPALGEMARWKTLRYALPAFVLLGRLDGLQEEEIHQKWERNDRESVMESVLGGIKKRKK